MRQREPIRHKATPSQRTPSKRYASKNEVKKASNEFIQKYRSTLKELEKR